VADADGALGCFDPSSRNCVYSSECGTEGEFVCAFDGRCRLECTSDCDCRNGEVCRERTFVEVVDDMNMPTMTMVSGNLCVDPTLETGSSTCLPDSGLRLLDAGVPTDAADDAAAPPVDAFVEDDAFVAEDAT
jgi:hypothetical protein